VGFEIITAVVTKNSVFCDIMSCSPFKVKRSSRWRRHVPPKRRLTSTDFTTLYTRRYNALHGVLCFIRGDLEQVDVAVKLSV
jgi:hypothetical protein